MKNRMSRILAAAIAAAMAMTMIASSLPVIAQEETDAAGIVSKFKNPDYTAKPMARMWFSDASAGEDENDTIEKQITELAQAGYGGVEVAMLSDSASYTNDQSATCGWGTENWTNLLKKVYRAADKIAGGFVVDVTITAHWPPTLNTIDPNDDAASKELSLSYTKVTASDLAKGSISLNLPATKTADGKNAQFIFTDTLVAANVAQVTAIEGEKYVLDYTTLTGVDADKLVLDQTDGLSEGVDYNTVDAVSYAGSPAGIPDEAYCQAQGWDYADTLSAFGPEQADPNETAKVDEDFNRKRLADWQYAYTADLSGLTNLKVNNLPDIQVGDYVVLGTYYRGTGQLFSGGSAIVMHNRCYVPDYFSREGIDEVTGYWNQYLLSDPELRDMMERNGGSIFEDSIEATKSSSFWSHNLTEKMDADYAYANVMPAILSGVVAEGGWGGGGGTDTLDFVNVPDGLENRIIEDYNTLLGRLYEEEHCAPAVEWAAGFNYNYRSQAFTLTGLDIAGAAAAIDIPEGDNNTKGDGLRLLSSAVNMTDKKYLSMEAVTGRKVYYLNWADVLTEVTANFSHGVNRVVLHGTPYSKSINGFNADWPGWVPFGSSFCDTYTYRQPYWEDAQVMNDYIARNQAVLQYGKAKVDLVMLNDASEAFSFTTGNEFQKLLDSGYSYNILSEAILKSDNAKVQNKQIYADGPGYKALVLNQVSKISVDTIETVLGFAKEGLPVVLYNSDASQVYGTDPTGEQDAAVVALFDELKGYATQVSSEEELLAALDTLGVERYAQYDQSQLETSLYVDPENGTRYYYLFNNAYPTNGGMLSHQQSLKYKGNDIHQATVTLQGSGTPYYLDAMTGEITQIGEYTVNADGTITFCLDTLAGGASKIVAIADDTTGFPAPSTYVSSVDSETNDYTVVREDGVNALRSNTPGTFAATLSDGTKATATVENALEDVELTQWNLEIHSFGPAYSDASEMVDENTGIQTVDPSETVVSVVDFGSQPLGSWSDIPASQQQLDALGVSSMNQVSGIGYYTAEFTLPDNWNATTGAYLKYSYNIDQVTGIAVNGAEVVPDNISDRVDIGAYLKAGDNTITIKVATTLINRAAKEHSVFTTSTPADYGLNSVTLQPYTQIALQPVAVSTAILDKVISYAKDAIAAGEVDAAIESVSTSFYAAYNHALEVQKAPESQQDVDDAWIALMTEIHKLGFVRGDAQMLQTLYDYASALDLTLFVQNDSKAAMPSALAQAKDTLDHKNDKLADEIERSLDELLTAVEGLRYKADRTILDRALAKANEIDTAAYTPQSVEPFNSAKQAAQETMDNADATQQQVDLAASGLEDAMDSLAPLAATVTGDKLVTTGSSSPVTGDAAPIGVAAAAVSLACAAALLYRRKK